MGEFVFRLNEAAGGVGEVVAHAIRRGATVTWQGDDPYKREVHIVNEVGDQGKDPHPNPLPKEREPKKLALPKVNSDGYVEGRKVHLVWRELRAEQQAACADVKEQQGEVVELRGGAGVQYRAGVAFMGSEQVRWFKKQQLTTGLVAR